MIYFDISLLYMAKIFTFLCGAPPILTIHTYICYNIGNNTGSGIQICDVRRKWFLADFVRAIIPPIETIFFFGADLQM